MAWHSLEEWYGHILLKSMSYLDNGLVKHVLYFLWYFGYFYILSIIVLFMGLILNHSQTQNYFPHDVHYIMIQPKNQNADQQRYQHHTLIGIGTFTQCRLCDIYFYFNFDIQVYITFFDISGNAPVSNINEGMKWFYIILSNWFNFI